jgi:hypothetical protein
LTQQELSKRALKLDTFSAEAVDQARWVRACSAPRRGHD